MIGRDIIGELKGTKVGTVTTGSVKTVDSTAGVGGAEAEARKGLTATVAGPVTGREVETEGATTVIKGIAKEAMGTAEVAKETTRTAGAAEGAKTSAGGDVAVPGLVRVIAPGLVLRARKEKRTAWRGQRSPISPLSSHSSRL